jgi:murein endopeptidase
MRSFVAAVSCLLLVSSIADARTHKRSKKREARALQHDAKKHNKIVHEHAAVRGPVSGQSIGAPWNGELHQPTALPDGEGYVIRHPSRRFGTATTIEYVERAIAEAKDAFPDTHVLAIGDISAEHGGRITEHNSHQSGRDVDIGLFYDDKPEGYPASFVHATADNLDYAATFKLLLSFVETAHEDGGAQMIFLDYDVQGLLYNWAVDHGFSEEQLGKIFQFAHGRGASEGFVRHWPNHDNHMHVRFKCGRADDSCE